MWHSSLTLLFVYYLTALSVAVAEQEKQFIMKKYLLLLMAMFSCGMFAQKNIAIAEQVGGVYIFNDCTPLGQYEVLGDVLLVEIVVLHLLLCLMV